MKNGFRLAEALFTKLAIENPEELIRSGSCATVVLIVGEKCFIANVGDSRSVLSSNLGLTRESLTIDHKPLEEIEMQRI